MEGTWSLDAQARPRWTLYPAMGTAGSLEVVSSWRSSRLFELPVADQLRVIRITDEAIVLPVDNRWAIGKIDGGTTERRSLAGQGDAPDEDRLPGLTTTASNQRPGLSEEVTFKVPGKAPGAPFVCFDVSAV